MPRADADLGELCRSCGGSGEGAYPSGRELTEIKFQSCWDCAGTGRVKSYARTPITMERAAEVIAAAVDAMNRTMKGNPK